MAINWDKFRGEADRVYQESGGGKAGVAAADMAYEHWRAPLVQTVGHVARFGAELAAAGRATMGQADCIAQGKMRTVGITGAGIALGLWLCSGGASKDFGLVPGRPALSGKVAWFAVPAALGLVFWLGARALNYARPMCHS